MPSPLEWITSKISLLGTRLTKHPRFEQAAKEAFELNDVTGDGMLNNRELHGEGARTGREGWRGRGPTIARSPPRASPGTGVAAGRARAPGARARWQPCARAGLGTSTIDGAREVSSR